MGRRDAVVREARRLAAVPRIRRGESLSTIARSLGVTRQAVHLWAQEYRQRGIAGLRRQPQLGCPPKLACSQLIELKRLLASGAEACGFAARVWTKQRVAGLVRQRFGVRCHPKHVRRLLHGLGWSWQKSASRFRDQAEKAIRRQRPVASSSLTGTRGSLATALRPLRNTSVIHKKKVTIGLIQKFVGAQFGLRVQDLEVRSNSKAIAFPRQIAMYIVRQLTSASLPEIGKRFGGKHHTTVLHSIRKIEALRRNDKDLNRALNRLLDLLG